TASRSGAVLARADTRRRVHRARHGRMNSLLVVAGGFRMNLKMVATSAWFLLMAVIQPIIFATIAYYMFRSGGRSGTLLYASLGAGMMGVWSSTLFGSGGMI